jgi:transposase-like protein
MLNNDILDNNIINNIKPILFGSNKYIYSNRKGINKVYMKNIYQRNVCNDLNNFNIFYDEYNDNYVNMNSSYINKYNELLPNLQFYKQYEPDLYMINDLTHFYNQWYK